MSIEGPRTADSDANALATQLRDYALTLPTDSRREHVDTRCWVASLVAEALWLDSFQGTYHFSDQHWQHVMDALLRYAELGPLNPPVLRAHRSNRERLSDQRPLVDAVLRLALAHTEFTRASIARAAGRPVSVIRWTYATTEELLADVVDQIHGDAFDDLSPLPFALTREAVAASLHALDDEHKVTAIHKLYAILGVPQTAGAVVQSHARAAAEHQRALSVDLTIAHLALDGWRGLERGLPHLLPKGLPQSVVRELVRLTGPAG